MPDPKIKRVIKRNLRDPLSPSELDKFTIEDTERRRKKDMKKQALSPTKRTSETRKKEILKSNQDFIKRKRQKRKQLKK